MHSLTHITIRFSDCDPMGHTNNAVYFTYMEQARVDFFRDFFVIPKNKPITPTMFPFILAEISCKFLNPTYADQTLEIFLKVSHVGNSSFHFEYEMKDKASGEMVATGKSAQVWYDYKTGKSAKIPEDVKGRLVASC
jgi:acyl-CoA thioester hydrolase